MNKYLLIAAALMFSAPAYAGYDIDNKNIIDDVSTLETSSMDDNDYVKVYSVTDTQYGWGTSYKARLNALTNPVKDLTAASTLTTTDCGKTLLLNSATEFATTLPAPTSGCKLKFIVKAAPASASYTVVTASSSNILIGGVNELETDTGDDGPSDTDADTITFADGVAVVGDMVEMNSDGTSWYFNGQAKADGGITLATAS